MTLLNPVFLWFLPLIAVPIIIHLLAKRKSKLVEFPSLKFLKLLEQDALRKFNIKQLLLLIIRTLMILLIIIIFARPSLDQSSGFQVSTGSTNLFVIVLDNTASNRVDFEAIDGVWLDNLKERLTETGFRVVFCGLTDMQLYDSPEEIRAGFSGIHNKDLLSVISEQVDLLRYEDLSILWIGDGQDAREGLGSLFGWEKYLLNASQLRDAGISQLKLPGQGVRQGDTYEIEARIMRSPDHDEALSLELIINEKRQNQLVVEGDNQLSELVARVEEGGYQSGKLILSSDEADYNNTRHFILPAEGNIPVQVLGSTLRPDFWSIIKAAVDEQGLNLDIDIHRYAEIDNLDLSMGGTVIVDDASRVERYNWNRLETFVQGGGQLILFGEGGAPLNELLGFKTQLQKESNSYSLGLFLTPASTGSFNVAPLKQIIEENRLKVYKRYRSTGNELDETWVRYLDNEPFLGSNMLGDGRIIWFNTDFGMEANNLPILGLFPAIIIQFAQSQSIKAQTDLYNAGIGDTLYFYPTAQTNDSSPFSVQRPDGTTDYISPDENYILKYPMTNLPGLYKLNRGRQELQSIAVNISEHEAQAHAIEYSFEDTDIFMSSEQEEIETEVMQRSANTAIWPILLVILLLFWIVETYLSRIKATWRENV